MYDKETEEKSRRENAAFDNKCECVTYCGDDERVKEGIRKCASIKKELSVISNEKDSVNLLIQKIEHLSDGLKAIADPLVVESSGDPSVLREYAQNVLRTA